MDKSIAVKMYQLNNRYLPCFFGDDLLLFDKDDRFGKIVCNPVEAAIVQAINDNHTLQTVWAAISTQYNFAADNEKVFEAFNSYIHRLIDKEIIVEGGSYQSILGDKGKYYPLFVTLELTNFCNFQCTHCYKEANPNNATFISTDLVESILRTLNGKAYSLELTGGEATVHPQFAEIVSMCAIPKLYLITNGSNIINIDDATLKKLSHVQVSMYGRTDYEYRKYARSCAFSAFYNGLKKLVELNIPTTVAIILRKDNITCVDEYLDLLYRIGIRNVRFGLSVKTGRNAYDETDWDLTLEQCDIAAERVSMFAKTHPEMNIDDLDCSDEFKPALPKNQEYTLACDGGKSMVCISESGLVRPCVMLPEKYFGKITWTHFLETIEAGTLVDYDRFIPACIDDLRKKGRSIDSICVHGFKCK